MKTLLLGLLIFWATLALAQQPAYLDESQPMDERIDNLLSLMTETEKQALLDSYQLPKTTGIPRLGIQPFVADTEPNTMFPSFDCLAATWNTELSRQYGCKVAEQALYRHVDRLYDPALSEMCEDRYLASQMISPYIAGVHSYGVEIYQDGQTNTDTESQESLLRQILRRHLETTMNKHRPLGLLGTEEQKAVARTIAEEGIVLLKNDKNILPLKGNTVRTIWLIGNQAMEGLEEQIAQYGITVRCERMSLNDALVKSAIADIVILTEVFADHKLMPFLKRTPVAIQAWDLGTEGVGALAAVVCGEVNPSGKLTFVWDDNQEDTPPLFDFGHGLSYTNFEFTDFTLSSREIPIGGDIIGTVTVTNIGDREGAVVVQLYIHDIKSSIPKPDKEMKGFQKVNLKPGESKQLNFIINEQSLMYLNPETQQWWAEPGFYVAFVGDGADNLPLKARFHLK